MCNELACCLDPDVINELAMSDEYLGIKPAIRTTADQRALCMASNWINEQPTLENYVSGHRSCKLLQYNSEEYYKMLLHDVAHEVGGNGFHMATGVLMQPNELIGVREV